jgi:hypothetical protein
MATAKRPAPDQPGLTDNLPEGLAHVIERCLDTDPEQRWQSARDVRAELDWLATPKMSAPTPALGRSKWIWMAASAILSLIAGLFAFAYFTQKTPDVHVTRFSFAPPFKAEGLDVAVSPDGKRIAFADGIKGSAIWLRSVDSLTAEKLPGTENAIRPFWSPDGRALGFIGNDGLKRVDLSVSKTSVQTVTSFAISGVGGPRGAPRASFCFNRSRPAPAFIASQPAGEHQPQRQRSILSERKS